MIRCGITGHTGSIGSVIIKKISIFNFIKFNGDVANKKDVENWIRKNNFDLIIHLAAVVPIKLVNADKKKAYNVNFLGTKNIIDSILKFNNSLKWFFFASTSHVYKNKLGKISEIDIVRPINTYGLTKLKAENYISKKLNRVGIKYCIGRIFSTTNLKQKKNYFVPDIKRKILTNKSLLKFKNLNHYRDFISPYDICKIILLLWKKKFNGIINIASGKSILLKNVVLLLLRKHKKEKFIFYDNKIKTSLVANITKLKKIIRWKPRYSILDMLFNE
jgi:UDP-glucose 4-epimerase